jgi:hypothetical protein
MGVTSDDSGLCVFNGIHDTKGAEPAASDVVEPMPRRTVWAMRPMGE